MECCRTAPSRLRLSSFGLTAAAALGVPVSAQQSGPPLVAGKMPPATTAFVDVTVVPMDRERVLPHQTVVVQEGWIVALGPADQVVVPADARRIDGRGRFLMPGLADMHTHISRYSLRTIDRAFFLLLANGVTTIRDVEFLPKTDSAALHQKLGRYYNPNGPSIQQVQVDGPTMLRLREEIRAGRRWGPPRMYLASAWHRDSTQSIAQNLTAYKAAGYDFIKIYRDSKAERDTLIPTAHRLGIPLVAHGHKDLAITLQRRLRSFEHTAPYQVPDSLQAKHAAALAREGLWSCPCPISGLGTVPSPLERRYSVLELRLAQDAEPDPGLLQRMTMLDSRPIKDTTRSYKRWQHTSAGIKAFHDAGGGLLLGTDLPFPGNFWAFRGLQGFVQAGLTPYQALLTGTRNVAEYFGTLDSAGTVAVGKWADLLLLSANPLEDIRNAGKIAGVMAAGRWLSQADIAAQLDWYYREVQKPKARVCSGWLFC